MSRIPHDRDGAIPFDRHVRGPHRTSSLEKTGRGYRTRLITPIHVLAPPHRVAFLGVIAISPAAGVRPAAGGRRRWRARLWRRTWSWTARTWRTTSRPTRSRRRRPGISICNRPRACLNQSLLFRSLTLVPRLYYTQTYEAFCAFLLLCRRDLLDISPVLTEAAGAIVDVSVSPDF